MARLAASTWVAAPPETVFRVVEAPAEPLLPSGGPRLVHVDPPGRLGSRYRWEFRRLGLGFRLDSMVTEYTPGERICFRGIGGWDSDAQVELLPENGGTRLNFRLNFQFHAPVRWLVPGVLIRMGIWHALSRVKALAEGGNPREGERGTSTIA